MNRTLILVIPMIFSHSIVFSSEEHYSLENKLVTLATSLADLNNKINIKTLINKMLTLHYSLAKQGIEGDHSYFTPKSSKKQPGTVWDIIDSYIPTSAIKGSVSFGVEIGHLSIDKDESNKIIISLEVTKPYPGPFQQQAGTTLSAEWDPKDKEWFFNKIILK
ncbi:MAG: hypothetical protein M1114_01625 [Candidatus Dependentiae bacterium]|nr:hypothetical protein [Candidatus Dependentiae bacterium]